MSRWPRLIPCLLLRNGGFVKTTSFARPRYVGDPLVTVRLFNEREADELVILDTIATVSGRGIDWDTLGALCSECFMPLAYGGGVVTLAQMERLFRLGIEKVVVTTAAARRPDLIAEAAKRFGSQSVVVGIDAKSAWLGGQMAMVESGRRSAGVGPVELAVRLTNSGAGEIMLQSVDRDGTRRGYDLDLVRGVARAVGVPVIACGGAGKVEDMADVIGRAGAAAAAAGSLFVFKGRHDAVLINMPSYADVGRVFGLAAAH